MSLGGIFRLGMDGRTDGRIADGEERRGPHCNSLVIPENGGINRRTSVLETDSGHGISYCLPSFCHAPRFLDIIPDNKMIAPKAERGSRSAGAKRSLSFGRITDESVFYAIFEYPQVSKFVYEYLKSPHNQRSAPCSLRPNLQVRYAERRGSNSQPSPRNKLSAPLGLLLLQQLPQRRTDGVLRYVLPSRMEWVPLERERVVVKYTTPRRSGVECAARL